MKSSLRLAGAAALCASLLLTACAKSHETSTSTDGTKTTDMTVTATAAAAATPAADATGAPAAGATTAAETTTTTTTTTTVTPAADANAGGTPNKFIVMPVYPGSTELKDQDMTMSANGTSIVMKVYASKDDSKKIIDWYKSQLPASWKNFALSSGDKTTGTFSSEGSDGDQSIIISTQDDRTTRIQETTKHGK